MATRITNIGAFNDVRLILDRAMAAGGAVYHANNYAHAIKWRARAYTLRSLLYKFSAEEVRNFPGVLPSTPYDQMILKVRPKAENDNRVTIEIQKPEGKLFTFDGRQLDIDPVKEEQDALKAAAEKLKEELDL